MGGVDGILIVRGGGTPKHVALRGEHGHTTMEDKNPWDSYGKPCFRILNLSNNQM